MDRGRDTAPYGIRAACTSTENNEESFVIAIVGSGRRVVRLIIHQLRFCPSDTLVIAIDLNHCGSN